MSILNISEGVHPFWSAAYHAIATIISFVVNGIHWFGDLIETVDRAFEKKHSRNELLQLTERELKDIGITREQAEEEGRKGLFDYDHTRL